MQSIDIISIIVYVIFPAISSIVGYIIHGLTARLDKLEEKMQTRISDPEVRQIIADKVDPIREDLQEIKTKINKIIDFYINEARNSKGN